MMSLAIMESASLDETLIQINVLLVYIATEDQGGDGKNIKGYGSNGDTSSKCIMT